MASGIAARYDEPDARFLEHVGRDPADEEIHGLRTGRGILAHADHADVERARAPGHLDAGIERERLAVLVEADAAEKNGMPLSSSSRPNSKMSESWRKNARCSGKKRSKRVRLIWRVSAVVPENRDSSSAPRSVKA